MKLQLFILCCVLQSLYGEDAVEIGNQDVDNGKTGDPTLGNPGNLKATVNITETEAETKPENPVDTEMNSSQKNQSGHNQWKNRRPYWVPMQYGETTQDATLGGHLDGPLYIARAHVYTNGAYELLPGYLNQNNKLAYVGSTDGEIISTPTYELLANCNQEWYGALGGAIADTAFAGGKNRRGEELYICRVTLYGRQIIGRYHKESYACYIAYDRAQHEHHYYEYLICNNDGIQ